MGFDTSGYVLKSARSAPSNATTTAGADSGVLREHKNVLNTYVVPGDLVEVAADQYRAAVLNNPNSATQEYLFWAANSSNLAILEDASWSLDQGSGSIPLGGTLTVTSGPGYSDGTDRVIVIDDDGRSIASVLSITVTRGDNPLVPIIIAAGAFASQDADAGVVVLGAGVLLALGGGLSPNRGDKVVAVSYYLAAQKFWWTRNDSGLQRFGWDGSTQRWEPYKGSPPRDLGEILDDTSYTLTPRPSRFSVGDFLPGDPLVQDAYAMVRVGFRPDKDSVPAVVLVVSNDDAAATYSFPPGTDAVVGVTSGVLQWNPSFIATNAGRHAWYVFESFNTDSKGIVGDLKGASDTPLFICPIPGPTDYPLLRIGSRRHLRAIAADTDADLIALSVNEGEVGWSLTTGQIKFSTVDTEKADPDAAGFELLYLGAQVIYDGVSLTRVAVGTRQPVQLVDNTGTPTTVNITKELFIPASDPLPSPGTSGVMFIPDGTGIIPNTSATPGTRPNGSGLVRELDVAGDIILFGKSGCIESTGVVEFDSDLPLFPFLLAKGNSVAARELHSSGAGSRVAVGLKDRTTFNGEPLYFIQATVQPAVYANKARLVSRQQESYTLAGTEVLAFALDGTAYLWDASGLGAGTFDAATVAANINSVITGTGQVIANNGRIWIEAGDLDAGSVEIGFGSIVSGAFADRDLSGCAVLGFLPGWRVDNPAGSDNWLPDGGLALGVARSPQNLDRSQGVADYKARGQFDNAILSKGVIASPVFLVNNPPLLDVAGYDEGVFFQTVEGLYRNSLNPFEDVLYDFDQGRFLWAEKGSITAAVTAPTTSFPLGNTGVEGPTLHPAVGAGYGLYLDETGGIFSLLVLDEDYLLDANGVPGTVTLINRVNPEKVAGAQGSFTALGTTFTDPDATFISDGITAGYQLKIVGGPTDSQGSYIVANVTGETTLSINADVPFPDTGSSVSWALYEGYTDAVYDPGLLADVLYEQFNHLPTEPFTIRVLSVLGTTPPDAASQSLSRLQAVVADALARGRQMSVRFGQASGSPEAVVTALTRTKLGTISNGVLFVPDITDPHFTNLAFSILVGDTSYTFGGGNLTLVGAFTPDPGDAIQVLSTTGEVQFGDTTLNEFAESLSYYVQDFENPSDLVAGTCEVDPTSGELNLSEADMTAYGGTAAYFVEQMITEDRLDVAISPMSGAIFFNKPLRAMQLVEVSYYQADSSGAQLLDTSGNPTLITEFLPLFVRLEAATENTTIEYAFNPTTRTVRDDVGFQIWVNNRLQNYGNTVQCAVDATTSTITFVSPVTSGSGVQINYAVNETFGGEQGFTVSTPPVYRPPFYLLANESSFALETDRTSDMVPGKLLRVGAQPFYVKTATYDAGTDTTTVTIFPTPNLEAGSRAPGNDVLTLLTSVPVTTDVDGTPTSGAAGFLLTLTADYEPVDKGMLSVIFRGDVTAFAVTGHLFEIAGYPSIITASTLSSDGLTTKVDLSSPAPRGFDPTVDVVKVSVRPIYPPKATTFIGLGAIVSTEPFEVVLFGETDPMGTVLPGRTLVRSRDYTVDETGGTISFLSPVQAPFEPGQKLFVSYTRKRGVAPFVKDQSIILPRYRAGYVHATTPTEENGFLDAYLVSTCSFPSPDSFYVRAVPMADWMGEVAQIAVSRVASRTPHGGPVVVSGPATNNWDFGTIPVLSQERELQDQDRAARVFISLYDEFVRAFEQVKETISGDIIGDRDGKFRFFVGRNKVYGGPGYEDQITGRLQSRFVWSQVFESANHSFGVTTDDPIVDPETATQDPTTLVVSGSALNPWLFDFYTKQQKSYVLNDMDDTVLVRSKTTLTGFITIDQMGVYQQMWEASALSRLYPEAALAFTTTYPGLLSGALPSNPGSYAFLKLLQRPRLLKGQGPVYGSTFGQDIGTVENPAMGLIQNITGQVRPRARLPRARVWAYSATGFPDIDAATAGKPSVVATPLLLNEFPIDPTTGLPDITQLVAGGGSLYDLTTGDVELSTPKWEGYDGTNHVYPQVAFGHPTGDTYSVAYSAGTIADAFSGAFPFVTPPPKGIFVYAVYSGCILTFTADGTAEITNPSDIYLPESTEGFNPERGDTIFVIPPGSVDASAFSNPPVVEEMTQLAEQQPNLDVGVRERRSTFVDWSLPSKNDPSPFPIKEFVGQKSANPLQPIEANVEFVNTMRDPFEFPALKGQATNDSGDYTLPYLVSGTTELDRLGTVQGTFNSIVMTDAPLPCAVYPDEIVGNDGSIIAAAVGTTPPATLLTAQDFTPVTTGGGYAAMLHSGRGDVRAYDLLLVEKNQTDVVVGAQGILAVGDVTTSTLEPPRFVTPTLAGDSLRYRFTNAMVHLTSTGLSGVVVQENGGLTTTLNISTVGGLFFNDGSGAATGGLNDVVSNALHVWPANNNRITIEIIDQTTGLILETVTIQGGNVTGGLGAVAMGAVATFTQKVVIISAVGFVDFAALGGAAPGPVGPFDFKVSVDTFVSPFTLLRGSATAHVDTDRLTFVDNIDFRTVMPRGSATVGNVSVQGGLSVFHVSNAAVTTCTVNNPTSVNGGVAFTFLARDATNPDSIGTFDPSPGTGLGSVKVMGFEGHGNVTLPSTGNFTFSAIPSSDQDEAGDILFGTGTVADTGVPSLNPYSILGVTAGGGSLVSVVSGDVVVVTASDTGQASTKTGTYLVRHAVVDDGVGYHEVFASASGGSSGGWVKSPFPTVLSASAGTITVSGIQTVAVSPSGYDWDTTGRLYLFVSTSDITQTVSRTYTGFVVNGDDTVTFILGMGTAEDATGLPISNAAFDTAAAAATGKYVSGMVYLPLGQFPAPLPDNNLVGYDHGVNTVGGFVNVTYRGVAGSNTFAFGADLVDASGAWVPVADQLGVAVSDSTTTMDSTAFYSDRTTPVYLDVALYVDIRGLSAGGAVLYTTIHGASASGVQCIAPGDVLQTHDGASTIGTGFEATAGLFLEPSFPRPTRDLGDGELKVVDAGNSVTGTDRIGMRSAATFGVASPEGITFEVRRVRRWHEVLDGIGNDLGPLRFAYEIRTGTVLAYGTTSRIFEATGTGTQLGGFDDIDVNVNPGDILRILDGSGAVVDSAEVAAVLSATKLWLRSPGLAVAPPVGGETFQIYLKQAPVPHVQSNEQLLDLITDQVILTRTADPVGNTGGRADTFDQMMDNGIADFSVLDPLPQIGDIVLIDPAGSLSGPTGSPSPAEYGSRPIGDQSVSGRVENIPGGPSDLDDNRGWYRIITDPATTQTYLEVSGETSFTGADGSPVILGASAPTDQRFVVYPDITNSGLTAGTEAQMAIRPTKTALPTNSYQDGSYKSIEPFSYRIIRPTSLVSEDTVDLVLMIRERMLSWVEEMSTAMQGGKQGSYYVFQRDEHVADLGSPTDGDDGLGVPSNVFITSLSGLTQYAPFANTSDCLSVLDRRVWCLDTRLDNEFPPYGAGTDPYTSLEADNSTSGYTVGSGRPVEPDLVDEVLDRSDRLRALRYSWIKFRANRENGTLPTIDRFLLDLPRLLQEQADLLRLQQSIRDSG